MVIKTGLYYNMLPDKTLACSAQLKIEQGESEWTLTQILLDPDEHRGWHMRFNINLPASREAGVPVLTLLSLGD